MRFGVSRNTKLLSMASLLVDVSTEMIFPLLPLFLTEILLAPVFVVGLMESLGEFAVSVASFFSGWYSDRIGKRRPIIISGYSLSTIVKTLLIFAATWPQAIAIRVLERIGKGVREAPRDALIMLSEEPGTAGKAFGFRKMLDNIGAVMGPLLATVLLVLLFNGSHSEESYRTIFAIALIPAVIAVCILLFIKEKTSQPNHSNTVFRDLFQTKGIAPFFLVMAVLSLGQFTLMLFLLRAADFLPIILIPVVYLAYNIFYTIFAIPAGLLADRIGSKKTMLIGMLFFLMALFSAGFFPSPSTMFISFALLGLFMATSKTIPQVFVSKFAPKNLYAMAVGSYKGLTGIVALPANLIAGALWTVSLFNAPAAFVFSIGTTVLAMVLMLTTVKD